MDKAMNGEPGQILATGISFKKATLETRNKFALTGEKIERIYTENHGAHSFFILSTCNRTEIYSTGRHIGWMADLLSAQSGLSRSQLELYCFAKSGYHAVEHLYRVASGLESQIPGDYEITGQVKKAFMLAKSYGQTNGQLEKILAGALQVSKEVKNTTKISDGTCTVSHAVIQLLKQAQVAGGPYKICLVGLGKIGMLTLKKLRSLLPGCEITLVNRTLAKAEAAAGELGVGFVPIEELDTALAPANALIVATGSDHAIISKQQIENTNIKLVFDLSVPCNVDTEVSGISGLQLYNIDQLSQIVNQSIEGRISELPKAEAIIARHIEDYKAWEARRQKFSTR